MSASNWAACPRCIDNARAAWAEKLKAVEAAYGQIPIEDFDRLRSEAAAIEVNPAAEAFQTFREDYEIYGADRGSIRIEYGGGCDTCGLSFSFQDERPFYDRVTA